MLTQMPYFLMLHVNTHTVTTHRKWALRETDAAVDDDTDGQGSLPANFGLFVTEANQHYAIAAPFDSYSFASGSEQFILQYTVRFTESMQCGGS